MGWIEWTGWNTGFFRMSESVFTEGRSWFLLMICSASCVLPTRRLSIKKRYLGMTWITHCSLNRADKPALGPSYVLQWSSYSLNYWQSWKVLEQSRFETTILLDSTYSLLKTLSFSISAWRCQSTWRAIFSLYHPHSETLALMQNDVIQNGLTAWH